MSGVRAIEERVDRLIRALESSVHGEQTMLIQQAAAEMCVSVPTVYKRLRARGYSSGRQLRSDRGTSDCSIEDLRLISATLNARERLNGKNITCVADAVDILRANGRITTTLSIASITRLLRIHKLDVGSLQTPSPHSAMRSRHPNHVWQVDSSICVLYYLTGERLRVMREEQFNIRKPEAVARVMKQRVLRYAATDHASGSIYARYFLASGETAETMFEFLMHAFGQSADKTMHGVPFLLGMDKAAAHTSHMLTHCFAQLGITVIDHEAANARANGQVENAHQIIETRFESRLAFKRIQSLDELNADLTTFLQTLNSTHIHSRHGHTRSAVWQLIKPEELRICPSIERCRALMMSKPITRVVAGDLHIEFTAPGKHKAWYPVSHVPGVRVGEQVEVSINPYTDTSVFIKVERDGRPMWFSAEPRATDPLGFFVDAPVWGESYKPPVQTQADIDRKRNNQLAWGTDDRQEKAAAMAKGAAFGGELDPMKDLQRKAAERPQFIARRGTELPLADAVIAPAATLSFYEFARALRAELGRDLEPQENAYLRGLNRDWTAADVQTIAAELQQPKAERPRLVAVK